MAEKATTTEEQLVEAAERALSEGNLVTTPIAEEMPAEYVAFRNLLRQVVKPMPRHHAAADPDEKA